MKTTDYLIDFFLPSINWVFITVIFQPVFPGRLSTSRVELWYVGSLA